MRAVCWAIIALALWGSDLAFVPAGAQGAGGPPPAPVEVAPVIRAELASGKTFSATVEAWRTSTVGAEFAGLVASLEVRPGDSIGPRALLAKLDERDLELTMLVAVAARDAAQAQHAAAAAELTRFEAERNELDSGSRPEEIEQARAKLAAAEADARYWEARYRRAIELGDAVAAEERILAETSALGAAARVTQSAAALALVLAGAREEQRAQARARVLAQQAILAEKSALLGAAKQRVAQLERDRLKLSISSPFEGVVVAVHTEAGQWLKVGDPIAEILDLTEVEIVAGVLEDYIRHVHLGLEARIEIEALPGELLQANVSAIIPIADPRSRTFPVKIRIANQRLEHKGWKYKAGMFARVTLAVGETAQVLLASKDAVVLSARGTMVYVVGSEGGPARPVPIELGAAREGLFEVRGQLAEGDLLVVRGNERLRPMQPVRIVRRIDPTAAPTQAAR